MSRLLERFLRYVKIDTQADDSTDAYPSSPGQVELGYLLADELRNAGLSDVEQDQHGIVYALLPSSVEDDLPTITLCAHLDTSPETSGKNVKPQVIQRYEGGDIVLPGVDSSGEKSRVIRTDECDALSDCIGKTIITTDGTTLLGADDKAGIAVIMETVQWLAEHPEIPHGPVRVCFTCDEEIGRGTDHVDLAKLDSVVCYTLDGSGCGPIDVETFSADLATIEIDGVNIHPSIAKGKMTNALRAMCRIIDQLPIETDSPESTDARQGFIHPMDIAGGVEHCICRMIIRDFEEQGLKRYEHLLRDTIADVQEQFPNARIRLTVKPQYRNMRDGLLEEPRAVNYACEAMRRAGIEPETTIVRGGTDGSQLTAKGLPTPNLGTGQHTPHSHLEWACLDEMADASRVLIELVQVWANGSE